MGKFRGYPSLHPFKLDKSDKNIWLFFVVHFYMKKKSVKSPALFFDICTI